MSGGSSEGGIGKVLAQWCHFRRSERDAEWIGGLRKRGIWGLRGEEDGMEEEKEIGV